MSPSRQILLRSPHRAAVVLACAVASIFGIACGDGGAGIERESVVRLGGDLTVFNGTMLAYDTPNPLIRDVPALMERFMSGDLLYSTPRVAGTDDDSSLLEQFGGLGPLYVGKTCTTCHLGSGRSTPTLFTHGGSGFDFSVFLTFLRTKNGQLLRDYGRVLHDQATFGHKPEGRLKVTYLESCARFPSEDHEEYCLIRPQYLITDWYTPPFPERPNLTDEEIMKELVVSVRTPLRHVGLGLMLAVDRDELNQLASRAYPEFGISGKLQEVFEKGALRVGLSGHKANHYDLTIELGLSSDMGVTNARYPEEVCDGQSNCSPNSHLEISSAQLADIDFYLHNTGVPARRHVDDPEVVRGEELFSEARCNLCHTPTLHTGSVIPELIDGTPQPHLTHQTIHPYSDYLLHDMGPELGDEFSQGLASGDEWRTTPLWGLGLQEVVSGNTHFLHDGRARNLVEAILWHGQEGSVSRESFLNMSQKERKALIAFLQSL